ncbi:hypothetical protein [Selenomonas sp. AE3005]|uniref:hypothetical protein n=1 Tax=Selenomonas sp. AE3005 TaxID=1485543 RepID=UPI0025F991E5|nr:hypothetical protein [Selenomonas sp. AE3005]
MACNNQESLAQGLITENVGNQLWANMEELKTRLSRFIGDNNLPPTPNLSKNIGHAESIIKDSVLEPDTIDWKDGTLYILDPFLLFYLRWEAGWKE